MNFQLDIINQKIELPTHPNMSLYIKREDKIHPFISGNKYRKLKYNFLEAAGLNQDSVLSFGGAYSNHIAAVAAAGKASEIKTIGVIRGEELEEKLHENATLSFAKSCGMQLKFVSRTDYKLKHTASFIDKLHQEFGDFYCIPEGGTNTLAVKGCEEILTETDADFNFICCAVGTGGTISGLINASNSNQKILGFPALKGDFLQNDISKFAAAKHWELISDYHFGGYAKINSSLVEFINKFKSQNQVPLDPVYTGKMMYGIFDMIEKNYFPENAKILVIHTGGLQGIEGMNALLKKKKLPIID